MFRKKGFYIFLIVLFFLGFLIFYNSFNYSSESFNFDKLVVIKEQIVNEVIPKEVALLGKAEVSYLGSTAGRIKNIELGIARINGKVIPNGKEFSFIEALGPINESDGFSKEKAFKDGEVTLGLGGGLCQVSTILFQTALSAGLPITERYNHTFLVPYYEVGLDATYSDPAPDFKFVNDTGYDITIKGWTEENKGIFEFYGISDGRVATLSPAVISNETSFPATEYIQTVDLPKGETKCEHASQSGFTAEVLYNVLFPSGINKEQVFTSIYKPLARVCYEGVDANDFIGCTGTNLYSTITGKKCPAGL